MFPIFFQIFSVSIRLETNEEYQISIYHTLLSMKLYCVHKDWYFILFNVLQVRTAAPMVDTKAPPTYMHLHLKLKKLQVSYN